MAVKNYAVKLTQKLQIGTDLWQVKLELPVGETMEFAAGQAVALRVPGNLRRQYSIASTAGTVGEFELIIDTSPGGPGSQLALDGAVGDTWEFLGPVGNFKLRDEQRDLMLIATGTGIAPFYSMLSTHLPALRRSGRKALLYWGLRTEADIYWLEKIQALALDYPEFQYHLCLSQPAADWSGRQGYCTVNAVADLKSNADFDDADFYLCGGQDMIKTGLPMLTEVGISSEHIFHERFY